jgi:hypothetical protein
MARCAAVVAEALEIIAPLLRQRGLAYEVHLPKSCRSVADPRASAKCYQPLTMPALYRRGARHMEVNTPKSRYVRAGHGNRHPTRPTRNIFEEFDR